MEAYAFDNSITVKSAVGRRHTLDSISYVKLAVNSLMLEILRQVVVAYDYNLSNIDLSAPQEGHIQSSGRSSKSTPSTSSS